MAVQRDEPALVIVSGRLQVDGVLPAAVPRVAERDLLGDGAPRDQPQGLQMRVERLDWGQRHAELVLGDVAEGDVVGEADAVAGGDEVAAVDALGERPGEAEAGAARREPEGDFL